MNADWLLAHYERIADAPEAVPRLRRFILDLAVRGKLVEQDPNDKPAVELLKRIAEEKAERVGKARETKNRSELPTVKIDEFPFEIPAKWCWARFGNIVDFSAGRTPSRNEPSYWKSGDHAWVSIADMEDGKPLTATKETISKKAAKQVFRSEPEQIGTIIMSFKLTIGKIARLGIPAYHNEAIISIRPHISEFGSHLFTVLPFFARQGKTKGAIKGATLNRASISNILIPLPPLAEQHRIVAKVDELMALCDRLEKARAAREATRDRMAAASLVRLNDPDPDPVVFRNHAAFALENLAPLTTRTDQIKALCQTILSLAVRGKLVEQDPNDEPTSELLRRMDVARLEMLEAGYPNPSEAQTQLKKLSTQTVPDYVENLPTGWSWATLQQCAMLVVDCKNKTAPYSPTGIRLVRTTNVKDGKLNASDQKYVNQETYEVWSARCKPETGDILITREAPMGEVCLIPPGETICLGQRIMLVRLVAGFIDRNFMLYSLRDPGLMDRVQDKPLGMTVQHLRVGGIETLLVAVPPLDEQHSIVAKVDELMVLCDRLEATLATDDDTRRRLLDALLHEVLPARRSRGHLTKRKTRAPKAIQRAARG